MKRLYIAFLLFILADIAYAQQSVIFLPVIIKEEEFMGNSWTIVQPVASYNYVLNPSAELTGNYSAVSSATINRVTTYQKYGLYSYEVIAATAGRGIQLTLTALTNAEHYVTVRVRGKIGLNATIGSATKSLVFIERIDNYWSLYGVAFSKAQANGQTALQLKAKIPGTFYVDGIQVEPLPYPTTYIDGTQDGCEWFGTPHAAVSSRSGDSLAGGKALDLYDSFGFFVEKVVGAGASPRQIGVDSYALLPGGELNNIKVQSREMTLIGRFLSTTEPGLHDNRQALLALLLDSSYPNNQPVKLRFGGASVQKEIGVYYSGGLEGDMAAYYGEYEPGDSSWTRVSYYSEKVAIQLKAPKPDWLEVGESAANLTSSESATFTIIAGRLKSTGQWSNLGPPAGGGAYTSIEAIAEDAEYVYLGGSFQNFDGIANADYIVRYNKLTGTYSAMGTGMNNTVSVIAVAPNGRVWVGGTFTSAGGVANTQYVAYWDGTQWNSIGVNNGAVYTIAFSNTGIVYFGGAFTSIGGTAANRIASYDGSSITAYGTGCDDWVLAVAVNPYTNRLYVGGNFTNANGVVVNGVTYWNGTTFVAMNGGMPTGTIRDILFDVIGLAYFAGSFTTIGGVAANRIAMYDESNFIPLGSGVNGTVYSMSLAPDGDVWVGGDMTLAGDITVERFARWNRYVWSHPDIDLPGAAPGVRAMMASKYTDTVIKQKYDLFVGFNQNATGTRAGVITATNEGTTKVYPKIIFARSGGTAAVLTTLRNERTTLELLFNYGLLDGESLILDLTPTNKTVISSFFGPRMDAILPNSDFGSFSLLKGSNTISNFIQSTGSPTITSYMLWRDAYDSFD